jgi:hypothetical protein
LLAQFSSVLIFASDNFVIDASSGLGAVAPTADVLYGDVVLGYAINTKNQAWLLSDVTSAQTFDTVTAPFTELLTATY